MVGHIYMDALINKRLTKFLGVGGLNTLFGYGIYACLLFSGMPMLAALFAATVLGVIFNYFSFGRMVFKEKGGWFVFGKFIVAYTVVYLINAELLSVLTEGGCLNAYFAQAVCILPSVLISWLMMKHWVYKNG